MTISQIIAIQAFITKKCILFRFLVATNVLYLQVEPTYKPIDCVRLEDPIVCDYRLYSNDHIP